MPFYTFRALVNWCCENTEITRSRNRKGIFVAQKLAIFLWIFGQSASNRGAQERFHYLGETISR